jgi:peptidoglycan hydrolase CwlO-like protein
VLHLKRQIRMLEFKQGQVQSEHARVVTQHQFENDQLKTTLQEAQQRIEKLDKDRRYLYTKLKSETAKTDALEKALATVQARLCEWV